MAIEMDLVFGRGVEVARGGSAINPSRVFCLPGERSVPGVRGEG